MHTNYHAGPNGVGHAGDLGNVTVGPDGRGKLELTDHRITLGSDSTGIIGKAVVLHANADNLGNSPANGGSGARLACGVLEKR
jgi:Cu-Zn family superoxide dismutase